jgi:hypothetical protein
VQTLLDTLYKEYGAEHYYGDTYLQLFTQLSEWNARIEDDRDLRQEVRQRHAMTARTSKCLLRLCMTARSTNPAKSCTTSVINDFY